MEPITPLTLLIYVPAFLVMLALYGNPFRVFFEKHLKEKNVCLDDVERVVLTLSLGAAVMPLIVMVLSLIGNILSVFVVQVLTVLFTIANGYLYRGFLKSFKPKLKKPSMKTTIVIVTFSAIFVFHLYPSIGLFVHPGNDPALYSLIATRIVETGGYATSWGSFAPQSWYMEKVHLLVAGFAGTCAFFNMLTGLVIEKAVTIITIIYTSLISLGVYFLAKRLFKSVGIALCSAFVFGMLVQEPGLVWFGWGGNAELSSLFLLPIAIGLFWEFFRNVHLGFRYMLCIAITVAGMSLLHPFSVFYLVFCLIPFCVYFAITRRKLAPILETFAVFLLSIAFILPVLITAVTSETAIMQLYESSPNPTWTPIFSWNQTYDQALYSIIWRFSAVFGLGTSFLLMLGFDETRHRKIRKEPLILLVAWALMLFLVHENNPNGLFLIPFPLWYRIDPNRLFTIASFAVSIIAGVGVFKSFNNLRAKSVFSGLTLDFKRKLNLKVILVLLLCLLQLVINISINSNARTYSPVTDADISAFNWIKQNTSSDATFFVVHNDAGYWLPIYTHRRVVIPFGVVTNYTLYDQYIDNIHPAFCEDPNSLEVLSFLNYHNVSYVYVGSKTITFSRIYAERLDPNLLAGSSFFKLVYNQSDAYIFEYLGASPVTIWTDESFLSGWVVGAGMGGTVDVSSDGGIYKLATTTGGYTFSTHGLSLSNTEANTYLVVTWRTTNYATFKIEVVIDGEPFWIIDRQSSSKWTTSMINLNNYAIGNITSVSILADSEGECYTDFIGFQQLP